MVREILFTLLVFTTGGSNLAFRNPFEENADELDLVDDPALKVSPWAKLLKGLLQLQPLCGKRLLAKVSIYSAIGTHAFSLKKDGGVIASIEFKDVDEQLNTGLLPVTPGMSLFMVGTRFAGPWTSERQATDVINGQIEKYGLVELVFDAGVDMRACWHNMHSADGMRVCGDVAISELARALRTLPARATDNLGQGLMTMISSYPHFVFKSFSEKRDLFLEAMPEISFRLRKLERDYGGVYASDLTPICAIFPGADGTDWLMMRKVEIPGAATMAIDDITYLDLKGPKFVGKRGKMVFDGTLWGGTVAKHKDLGFAEMFPTGLTVSSCGGREVAFSLGKDAELLEALAMTDFSLLIKFYEADPDSKQHCSSTHRDSTFPVILNVVEPVEFRIALGIIDYVLPSTTKRHPKTYREHWMHMWPNYFQLSRMSLVEYRSELFAKRIRGFEVSKVMALMRMRWSDTGQAETAYNKNIVQEASASLFTVVCAYRVLPGELGTVEGQDEDGLLVRWDNNSTALFWVPPENVMPAAR